MPAGTLRAVYFAIIVCFSLFVFTVAVGNVSAQDAASSDDAVLPEASVNDTEQDPFTAAEQALILGDDPVAAAPVSGVSALGILRIIITLAVVAAAIYGLVYIIKKASKGSAARDPYLKVLAAVPLGANRGAWVISLGTQAWLVGAAEGGVNLIAEVADKDILNAMLLDDSRKSADLPSGGPMPDFRSFLRRLGMPVDSKPPGPENIRGRRERLKGL